MESRVTEYNIEDTGTLMTKTKGKSHTLRVILLVCAVLVVIITAFLGYRMINDKRYNEQIDIADKAFVEGDYETAETAYSKAVDMNKRKLKARESLAYTCAIQGKTEESIKVYEALYDDTKDKKYREAVTVVTEGSLPADRTLIPAIGIWRETNIEDIPYYDDTAYYIHGVFCDYSANDYRDFDCKNPEGFPFLSLFMTGIGRYGYEIDKEDSQSVFDDGTLLRWVKSVDPRTWCKEVDLYDLYGGHEIYDVKKTDHALKEVFNITDNDIKESLKQAEADKQIYKEDGKYYCVYGWPTGTPGLGVGMEIQRVWTDGEKYCIQYDAGSQNDRDEFYDVIGIDRSLDYTTCYIVIQEKTYNNNNFWSLYYNGKEAPAEISEVQNRKTKPRAGKSADAYKPVIDEYNKMLDMYYSGYDFSGYGYDNNDFEYVYYEIIPNETFNEGTIPEYSICDINGDGVDELIIGGNRAVIGSIFTLDSNNKPVLLINCDSYMYRAQMYIYENGSIEYSGSSSAFYTSWTFYEIDKNNAKLVTAAEYVVDTETTPQAPYALNGKKMAEDDFVTELENRESQPLKKLQWEHFSNSANM